MPKFDSEGFMNDPLVAIGMGLLSSNNPQEGMNNAMGLLSKNAERKRQQRLDQINEMLLQAKIKEMDQPDYRNVGNTLGQLNKSTGKFTPIYEAPPTQLTTYQAATLENQGAERDWRHDQKEIDRQEKERRRIEDMAGTYSAKLQQADVPSTFASLKGVKDILDLSDQGTEAGKGDIPGYGLTGNVPQFMLTNEGKNARQSMQALMNNYIKMQAGLGQTAQEATRQFRAAGLPENVTDFKTDDQFRKGFDIISSLIGESVKNIEAGYAPEAVDLYQARGGQVSSKHPIFNKPGPAILNKPSGNMNAVDVFEGAETMPLAPLPGAPAGQGNQQRPPLTSFFKR